MKHIMEIAALAGVEGFLHPAEADWLMTLAAGKHVLEVGSFMGLSAFCMATVAKRIMCVDTFKANSAGQQQMGTHTTLASFDAATERFSNIKRFVGTSAEAAGHHAVQGQFDLIFLDAMHTYEDVLADINRWWPRVRTGGVMAFHDYGHDHFPGVKQAVDEKFGPQANVIGTLMWMSKTV